MDPIAVANGIYHNELWGITLNDRRAMYAFGLFFVVMNTEQRKKILDDRIIFLFGNLKNTIKGSINGTPIFNEMQMLNIEDTRKMYKHLNKLFHDSGKKDIHSNDEIDKIVDSISNEMEELITQSEKEVKTDPFKDLIDEFF